MSIDLKLMGSFHKRGIYFVCLFGIWNCVGVYFTWIIFYILSVDYSPGVNYSMTLGEQIPKEMNREEMDLFGTKRISKMEKVVIQNSSKFVQISMNLNSPNWIDIFPPHIS